MERLQITRETWLEFAAEGSTPPSESLPPGYREILAAFEKAGQALRADDVCQALGTETEPRRVEGIRAKLKRLVSRGILTEPEPEPGLFTLSRPARPAPEPTST